MPSPVWPLPICLDSWTWHSRFLCNIFLYSIGLYFHHQSYPQLSVVFLWLGLFILSGSISPLFSSSILGTYQPGEFIFQYPIILPFHTVHGVLKARILKWFTSPFSSGPGFVRILHRDPSVFVGMVHSFTELGKAVIHVISLVVFYDCGSHSVCPLMDKDKRLVETSWWKGLVVGESGSCSDGWSLAQ